VSKFVLTAQLNLKAPNNVAQVVSQMQKQLSGVSVNLNVQGAAKANKQISSLTSNMHQASKASKGLGSDFAQSVRRFSAMAIATRAVSLFTNTLSAAIRESIDFERELVKIAQVTGKTVEQLRFLTSTVSSLSTNLGVASGSLLSVSRMLSQAGLSARETETALRTLAMTELAPTFDNITQTAEGAIAIFNQFGKGAAALEQQLGAVNAVAGQFAVESGDLISAVRRTGGVFKAAGGDLNELIALFTSVRATTRESAESISTGLRTIFTRIQRPRTIEFMKKFGVELTDMEGKFVGPFEAVKRLSAALSGLEQGDTRFIKIAEELGGFRQIGKVIPLIQQFSTAQSALNVAQKGSSSLAKDAATAQQSLAVQIMKVKQEFLELIRGVTETPVFQAMASGALTLASALIKVADSLKPILPIITAIAAVKFTKGIASFAGGIAGKLGGFSKGGKVLQYASGGMVPGSGNRDTVPAMLTPGEFVIRKKSVAKLGAGNLAQMNTGGLVPVQKFEEGSDGTGVKSASRISAPSGRGGKLRARQMQGVEDSPLTHRGKKLPDIGLAALRGSADTHVNYPIDNIGKNVTLRFGVLKKEQSEEYEQEMRDSVESVASRMAQDFAKDIKDGTPLSKADTDAIMDKAGFSNAVGAFFESALAMTGVPYNEEGGGKAQINDSIDFASGLGAAAESFDIPGNIPTDATRTSGRKGKSANKFKEQVGRWLSKTYGIPMLAADEKAEFKKTKMLAAGGPAGSGTDTVPAMLTPGEFVVNKKSAQRVGYGSLNRMNKVGKYAQGGVVKGGIQHFKDGGTAKSGGGITGLGAVTEGLVGAQMALAMLTPTIDENSSAFERGVGTLMGGMNSFVGMLTLTQTALAAFNIQLKAQDVGKLLKGIFKTGKGGLGDMIGGFQKKTRTGLGGKRATVTTRTKGESFGGNFKQVTDRNERARKLVDFRKNNPMNDKGSPFQIDRKAMRADLGPKLSKASGKSGTAKLGQFMGNKVGSNPMVQAGLKKLSGPLKLVTKALGPLAPALQGMLGAIGPLAGHLTAVAGPALAAAGGMKLLLDSFDAVTGRTEALNKAIEEGSVAEAEKVAYNKAGAEAVTNLAAGMTAAGGLIGGPFGAAIGAATGAFLKVMSEIPKVGPVIMEAAGFINQAFGGKSLSSIVALAGANAAANKATKDLADAQKEASNATEDFTNGSLTAAEALAKVQAATASVDQSQEKAKKAVTENNKNKAGTASGIGRGTLRVLTLGIAGAMGVESGAQRNERLDTENKDVMAKANQQDAERFEMTKGLRMSSARSTLSMGGSYDDAAKSIGIRDSVDPLTGNKREGLRSKQFRLTREAEELEAGGDKEGAKLLMESAKQTEEQILELERSLKNLQKAVEEQKKAFAAMNLGLNSAQGAAGAFTNGMKNYQAAQEAGNVSVMRSFETLKAGVGKAAAGMDPKEFDAALQETSNAMREFGVDDDQIKKFEGNLKAVNQAQRNSEAGLKSFSASLNDRSDAGLGGKTGEEQFTGLFDTIVGSVNNLDDATKDRLKDMLKGMEGDIEYDKIAMGDFSQINEVFEKLGLETLDQAKALAQAEQFYQDIIVDAAKKRAEAESALIDATRQQLDYLKESKEIIASAGGPAVTAQDRQQMSVDRYNAGVTSGPKLSGSSAADIKAQQTSMIQRNSEINDIRRTAADPTDPNQKAAQAQLKGEGGANLDAEQQNLAKQNQQLYQTTKALIDSKREEIKVIQEKNKLEKDSFESLLDGDIDSFFQGQATQGAISAIGSGNSGDFDADTLKSAYDELKRLQEAGVDEVNGQKISGQGGLLEKAATATATARGADPATAALIAQKTTQQTPAEAAANQEIQQLAATLPAFGDIAIDSANLQMEAAQLQKEAAELQKEKVNKEAEANKGKTIPPPEGVASTTTTTTSSSSGASGAPAPPTSMASATTLPPSMAMATTTSSPSMGLGTTPAPAPPAGYNDFTKLAAVSSGGPMPNATPEEMKKAMDASQAAAPSFNPVREALAYGTFGMVDSNQDVASKQKDQNSAGGLLGTGLARSVASTMSGGFIDSNKEVVTGKREDAPTSIGGVLDQQVGGIMDIHRDLAASLSMGYVDTSADRAKKIQEAEQQATPQGFNANQASSNQMAMMASAAAPQAMSGDFMAKLEELTAKTNTGESLGLDPNAMTQFGNALEKFNETILQSITALQSTQFTIKLEPTTINLNLQGTSFLQTMTNELQNKLFAAVSDKLRNMKVGPDGRLKETTSEV
tara:strand:+ start:45661 stop:52410 length:6750 start_codon:yes stop_codon:yes gene_type:complete